MKKLGYLLVILFWLSASSLLAQPDDASWLNITVQTDQYGGETSWEILSDGNIIATSPPYQDNTLSNITIPLQAGDYTFIIYDSFGDGICCSYGLGWYSLTNTCGLEVFNYEFESFSDTVEFTLDPCLPVFPGCTNEESNNYNPWATLDDGTCNVSTCEDGQTLVSMNLTLDNYPSETGFTLVDIAVGEFYEQIHPGEFNFGDQNVTYTYDFCASLGFELIIVDGYGDGLNASQWGGTDGAVSITACGDTLWELTDIAFEENDGITAYSGAIFTEPCPPIPPVFGCMNDDYVDYNPLATAQDTCEILHTWGCTDPNAFNYDSLATISDNTSPCSITLRLEDDAGDGWGMSGIGITQGDQQWLFTIGPGQFFETWDLTLDSDEEVDVYYFQDGGQQSSAQELAFQTLHNSILLTNQAGDTLLSEGANPFFNNGQGALQPFAGPEWNVYSFIPYCGNSCEPFSYGCTDGLAQNYNADVNTEDGSCYYQAGCTQAGYLEYYTQGYEADFDNGSCNTLAVFGCMDSEAFNYNPEANVDNEGCIPVVLGCTNQFAFNFNPAANTDDNSCIPYIYGCTDPTMFNYDSEANTEDGSCIPYVYGCTDSDAFNYDPLANTDNGSCIETVVDCMDPVAYNYNPLANVAASNCLYAADCITGPGEPYWLNDMCYAWVIQADPYCCDEGWDATCQETYNYCESTGIETILAGDDLVIYPNPVGDILNINQNVDLEVFDSTGRIIVSETNTNAIDASLWAPGMYTVCIAFNNRMIIKKVIK
tara:strand:+ start:407 stop:2710 length:2304 start_codon:yes stop_codon:yes gene_type:complete